MNMTTIHFMHVGNFQRIKVSCILKHSCNIEEEGVHKVQSFLKSYCQLMAIKGERENAVHIPVDCLHPLTY